ncbi:MAG: hypothetical protein RQ847_10910 [Wenzhouxiangellaceae bacterium]|nr:hypothetical protein [Wenzhouxiangellaceae bacterium]
MELNFAAAGGNNRWQRIHEQVGQGRSHLDADGCRSGTAVELDVGGARHGILVSRQNQLHRRIIDADVGKHEVGMIRADRNAAEIDPGNRELPVATGEDAIGLDSVDFRRAADCYDFDGDDVAGFVVGIAFDLACLGPRTGDRKQHESRNRRDDRSREDAAVVRSP